MIPKNNSVILKLFFKESYVSVEMKGVCVCLNWILAIFVKNARMLVTRIIRVFKPHTDN